MIISAIAAMSENRVIGKDNKMPWHLPADLKHFKSVTTGHPVLMGRKTFESIGKPLPNRTNIVMSRDPSFKAEGCLVVGSLEEAVKCASLSETEEIFIIGGAEIYRQLMPATQSIYLTIVHHEFTGDAFFPELKTEEWEQVANETHRANELNPYSYSFLKFVRKSL